MIVMDGKEYCLSCGTKATPRRRHARFIRGIDTARALRHVPAAAIAFVPQEGNIFPSMTIMENLEIGSYIDRSGMKARIEQVMQRMPELAIKRRGGRAPCPVGSANCWRWHGTDGGPQDPAARRADRRAFAGRRREAVRYGSCDRRRRCRRPSWLNKNALHALEISDRAYILVDGRNSRDGPSAQLMADPDIRRIFLGD